MLKHRKCEFVICFMLAIITVEPEFCCAEQPAQEWLTCLNTQPWDAPHMNPRTGWTRSRACAWSGHVREETLLALDLRMAVITTCLMLL